MYSTLIRQQHMLNKKDYYYLSLRKSIIKRKAPIQSGAMCIPCRMMCLKQHGVPAHRLHRPPSPHREDKYRGKRY